MSDYISNLAASRNQFDLRMTRRDLIRRAVIGTATLSTGFSLLAACGDEDVVEPGAGIDDGDEPIDRSDDADDSEQNAIDNRRGGSLRVGLAGSLDTFDPHHPVAWEGIWIQSMLYSRLLRLDYDLEPVPEIATSWEPDEDGERWHFQLRDDVLFHDGRQLTAQDVKESFERIIDPDEGSVVAGEVTMMESVDVIDDFEVAVNLNSPYADFITLVGMYFMRIVDIDSADTLSSDPAGSGPYVVRSHSAGERTVLERFEDYFDQDNQAYLDTIEYITISENATRLTSLAGGEIDLVSEVPPTSLPLVEDAPGINLQEVATGNYIPICMRVDQEPFDDVRVRQAMKLAINREEYLKAVFQGLGEFAADHPIPPFNPMYGDIPIPERDIDRAAELLSEAGYPDGIDLELHTTAGRVGMQESALTFQEMARAAGIRVEVTNHPVDAFWAEIYMEVPFFVSNWSGRPVADQSFATGYFRESGWNETGWYSDELEDLVITARETFDEDERRELLTEAQRIMSEEGASIIPFFISMTGAWSDRVHGFQVHPLRWIDFHEVWVDEAAM